MISSITATSFSSQQYTFGPADFGIHAFDDLSLVTAGAQVLSAIESGAGLSGHVQITVEADDESAKIAIAQEPGSVSATSIGFSPPPSFQLRDQFENPILKSGVPISLTPKASADCGTFGGTGALTNSSLVTDSFGMATFTGVSFSAPGNFKLVASSAGSTLGALVSPCTSVVTVDNVPAVTITGPAAGSYINGSNTSVVFSGACNRENQTVKLTVESDTPVDTTCSSSSWTATVDVSGKPEGSIDVSASLYDDTVAVSTAAQT